MPVKKRKDPPCLLVADGDPERGRALAAQLEPMGFRVVHAADASACAAAVEKEKPALAIVDAALPPDGGVIACHGLAKPAVLVTDPADLAFFQKARDAGVADFLERPIHAGLLELRVREALRRPAPSVAASIASPEAGKRIHVRVARGEREELRTVATEVAIAA